MSSNTLEPLAFSFSVLTEYFTRPYGGRGRIVKLATNRSPQFRLPGIGREPQRLQPMFAVVGIWWLILLSVPIAANAVEQSQNPQPSQSPEQPKADTRQLYIQEYRVQGAHLLTKLEVEEAVYPFLGPERTADDVDQARAALEKAYQAKGYQTVSVQIPPQQVTRGVVILQVIEGKYSIYRT
jgi:hypothetical protein